MNRNNRCFVFGFFMMLLIIVIGAAFNLAHAKNCDIEHVRDALEMRNKYKILYSHGDVTKERYLMTERMLLRAKYCAQVISFTEYCDSMDLELWKIRFLQPEVYHDEMEDFFLTCD